MIEKARELGNKLKIDTTFLYSDGLIRKFKERHHIKLRIIHGESATISLETVDTWRKILQNALKEYSREDIYNFDESALFYKLTPNKALSTQNTFSGKKIRIR